MDACFIDSPQSPQLPFFIQRQHSQVSLHFLVFSLFFFIIIFITFYILFMFPLYFVLQNFNNVTFFKRRQVKFQHECFVPSR